ncbi:MAG: hypothetical protein F2826_10245, partial [Actinobacteria bacterium]|nr:hypothetical protein [Actinomycetota bacterium]
MAAAAIFVSQPPAAPAHRQVLIVTTANSTATVGTLEAYTWRRGSFHRTLGPVTAYVGSEGIGKASEWRSRTPSGVFSMTEGFGWAANPGTLMPYRKVGSSAWWVSDTTSPAYNTMQFCRRSACTFDTDVSEPLASISLYRHAMVINYNRNPIKSGAGSAFFLHESAGAPTAGCVAINGVTLTRVMHWLRPGAAPVISIAVGSKAYAPLASTA